jgi:hypothetical protein
MNHWVMDYETMINFFCGVFEDYKTGEKKIFVVHDLRNDFDELVKFLQTNIDNKERHISYNGLAFDAQITEYILRHADNWSHLKGCLLAHNIYEKAQDTIERSRNREWLEFYESRMRIPQLDVFKLNHWDNPAKRSSLKWIQFSMDWKNLQDMPIHHAEAITTQDEIDMIVNYCINDVKSTKEILFLSKEQINLRKTLTNEYGINLYSASEPKISKELFLHFLSEKTGREKKEIKYAQTKRTKIIVKDIILPYIKFNTPELQNLHEKFNDSIIDPLNTKGSIKYSVKTDGVKIDFGLGGVHGARKSGVYEANEGMTIMTSDVKSYYPNLAIKNKWSPAHINSDVFCELYSWFYDERVKIPKSDPRNYVYKIILNSTYGLSNDKFSFLYDPQFTMQITINGQLSLMMLYEMIKEGIPGAIPLMQNTDGVETMIPTEYIDKYIDICNQWEKLTMLELDHDEYQKLILADVNNYIAINKFKEVTKEKMDKILSDAPHALVKEENDKYYYAPTKCKGRFEFNGLALHKNKSNLVTSKALFYFFVHNVSPEAYLATNNNIFDYCIGKKIKGNWEFRERFVEKNLYNPNVPLAEKIKCIKKYGFYEVHVDGFWRTPDMQGEMAGAYTEQAYMIAKKAEIKADPRGYYKEKSLQPTIRYYISNKGSKIYKCNKGDTREIQVESGKWLINIMNDHKEKKWEDYGINDQYYIQAIYREIDNVAGPALQQLSLF